MTILPSPISSLSPSFLSPNPRTRSPTFKAASATERRIDAASTNRDRNRTALETRISLVAAVAAQAASVSQRFLTDLVTETAKYVFPSRLFESRNMEEALMCVPDLETVKFRVLRRREEYEIREVEPYFIAETTMPGKSGFDFNGSSQGFNVLAEYLFGKNTASVSMEMTTPVYTRKAQAEGEKMEMTTPVITKRKNEKKGKINATRITATWSR